MISDQDIRLIEKYLFGKLSEQENIDFENRIKIDSVFSEEVDFMRDLGISAKDLGRDEMRSKLKIIAQEYKTPETKQNNNFKRYLAIAASVVVIVGITAVFYYMQSNNGKNENNIANLQNDTINAVNKIINASSSNTKLYPINQADNGYGFAVSDSTAIKFPVLIVNSSIYNNHYLFRDTLFLFLQSEDSLRLCSIGRQPDLMFFEQGRGRFYFIELKKSKTLGLIMRVKDAKLIDEFNEFFYLPLH